MDSDTQAKVPWRSRDFDASSATAGPFKQFANRYFTLAKLEMECSSRCRVLPNEDIENECMDLAGNITKYLSHVGDAYDDNSSEKSMMLLTVMVSDPLNIFSGSEIAVNV